MHMRRFSCNSMVYGEAESSAVGAGGHGRLHHADDDNKRYTVTCQLLCARKTYGRRFRACD